MVITCEHNGERVRIRKSNCAADERRIVQTAPFSPFFDWQEKNSWRCSGKTKNSALFIVYFASRTWRFTISNPIRCAYIALFFHLNSTQFSWMGPTTSTILIAQVSFLFNDNFNRLQFSNQFSTVLATRMHTDNGRIIEYNTTGQIIVVEVDRLISNCRLMCPSFITLHTNGFEFFSFPLLALPMPALSIRPTAV